MKLKDALVLDLDATTERLSAALRNTVHRKLRRRGLVVAISGGVDSACVAALATRAFGPEHVFGLLMPEKDSNPESTALGRRLADTLGIDCEVQDIEQLLLASGCYAARDAAVRSAYPAYRPTDSWKIALRGDRLAQNLLTVYDLVVQPADGGPQERVRLSPQAYLQIVAATNFKQRCRKMIEYYHADRLVYAVGGTPNRLEYDQGFFVKLGDGAADVKPIASLYKTQTYALARHLGVIDDILEREPTTDTFSLEQSQTEFFFSAHHSELDLILWAKNHQRSALEVSRELGVSTERVERVYNDIDQRRRTTAYLHAAPQLLEAVPEIAPFGIG
jgi:NAD+ synthase